MKPASVAWSSAARVCRCVDGLAGAASMGLAGAGIPGLAVDHLLGDGQPPGEVLFHEGDHGARREVEPARPAATPQLHDDGVAVPGAEPIEGTAPGATGDSCTGMAGNCPVHAAQGGRVELAQQLVRGELGWRGLGAKRTGS